MINSIVTTESPSAETRLLYTSSSVFSFIMETLYLFVSFLSESIVLFFFIAGLDILFVCAILQR